MSTVQPTRPGAAQRRPGPPSQAGGTSQSKEQQLADTRNLPDVIEDGVGGELDPENASSGKMIDETATIASARFVVQDWKRKDGTYPENSYPEVQAVIGFLRRGDDASDKPYVVQYKYGSKSVFAITKDGNGVRVRPSFIKEGSLPPRPRKTDAFMLFLQSLKDAGGKNVVEKITKEGIAALVGLTVHVRERKFEGQHEKAKPVLAVDYIEDVGGGSIGAASAATAKAPAAQTASTKAAESNGVDALAEAALLDILGAADGNTISRAQIPTTLIRLDKWKAHEQRGAILKTLRDDAFVTREGQPWKVSGNSISL